MTLFALALSISLSQGQSPPPSYPLTPPPPPLRAGRASREVSLLRPPALHPRWRRGGGHCRAPPTALLVTGTRAAPSRLIHNLIRRGRRGPEPSAGENSGSIQYFKSQGFSTFEHCKNLLPASTPDQQQVNLGYCPWRQVIPVLTTMPSECSSSNHSSCQQPTNPS